MKHSQFIHHDVSHTRPKLDNISKTWCLGLNVETFDTSSKGHIFCRKKRE